MTIACAMVRRFLAGQTRNNRPAQNEWLALSPTVLTLRTLYDKAEVSLSIFGPS